MRMVLAHAAAFGERFGGGRMRRRGADLVRLPSRGSRPSGRAIARSVSALRPRPCRIGHGGDLGLSRHLGLPQENRFRHRGGQPAHDPGRIARLHHAMRHDRHLLDPCRVEVTTCTILPKASAIASAPSMPGASIVQDGPSARRNPMASASAAARRSSPESDSGNGSCGGL